MAAPVSRAMHDQDFQHFASLLRATFSLYGGRKVSNDIIQAYWMYLNQKVALESLPKALSDACSASPQFPPSAIQIAEAAGCGTVSRASQELHRQGQEVLQTLRGQKQLGAKSESAMFEQGKRELRGIIEMLSGKLSA